MEKNPYRAPGARVSDEGADRVEVTWRRAINVWWSLAWRMLVFGGIAGFVAGAIAGALGAAAGMQPLMISNVGSLAGFLVSLPVGMWVVRSVLRKSWSDFDIVLVARRG